MNDFVVALGLVLVIEGLVWAVVPGMALRLLASAAARPESSVRLGGLAAILCGVGLVWVVRG